MTYVDAIVALSQDPHAHALALFVLVVLWRLGRIERRVARIEAFLLPSEQVLSLSGNRRRASRGG